MKDLAAAAGLEYEYVTRLFYFVVITRAGWRALERTLKTPLFHSHAEFDLHERAVRVLGVDPITELAPDVRAAARHVGLLPRANTRRPNIATVMAHISALTPEQVEEFAAKATTKSYARAPKPLTAEQLAAMSPEERAELDLRHPPERQATERKKRRPAINHDRNQRHQDRPRRM